jgi:hypothetical protein
MRTSFKRCLCIISIFITSVGFAQHKAGPKFEIYLLMGQSNMAGRGPITDDLKAYGNDSVFVLNRDMQWVLARHPLHFDKPSVAGVGPGLAFGVKMARAHRNVRIGLVPCAVGGTRIEYWIPGAFDTVTNTHPYDDAVRRIKVAMRYGTIKGVIWHQGEANSNADRVKTYLNQLIELISRIRTLVADPNLPFIAGELGHFHVNSASFNPQISKLPEKVPFTAVVSSKGLTHKGDKVHFDGYSATKLGERYAKKVLEVQKQSSL